MSLVCAVLNKSLQLEVTQCCVDKINVVVNKFFFFLIGRGRGDRGAGGLLLPKSAIGSYSLKCLRFSVDMAFYPAQL